MPRLPAYAFVLAALSACSIVVALLVFTPEQSQGDSWTNSPADARDTVAEFRWNARSAYEIVGQPCDFAPDLKRKSVLAPELAELADLEQSGLSANLQSHLQVARDDAAYLVAMTSRDCSPERLALLSPAETRIEMDRSDLRWLLARMRALAPTLASEPGIYGSPASRQDAEFRYFARNVTSILSSPCPISRKTDRFHTLAESRDLVTDFRNRIRPTRFEVQFATAEADVLYRQSSVVVECVTPDIPTTPERVRSAAAQVKSAVNRMEEIAATELNRRP